MLTRQFENAGHIDRFTVTAGDAGWDVREERDDRVVRKMNYRDWHRVERAMQAFEISRRPAEAVGD